MTPGSPERTGPRCNWFDEEELDVPERDPFAAPIEEVAAPIDLRQPDLVLRLAELVHAETELGVRCPIRERAGSVCSACPISHAADSGAMGELCRNGVEQERVCTLVVIEEQHADRDS
jgi:hypothetical protein